MTNMRTLGMAAFLAMSLGGFAAQAADLDDDYAYREAPPAEAKVVFGSGWYVRGDLGVNHGLGLTAGDEPYDTTTFQQHGYIPATTSSSGTTINPVDATYYPKGIFNGPGTAAPGFGTPSGFGANYTASLGGGYQFNRWFRTDLVFDYHQPVRSSRQGAGHPCVTGAVGAGATPYQYEDFLSTTCTPTLSATLNSYDVLANGYIDLGTWYSVTPTSEPEWG